MKYTTEPKIGDKVWATMDCDTWFEGVYVKNIDLFAQFGVMLKGSDKVRYFTHIEVRKDN